jgi:hypothetical protein
MSATRTIIRKITGSVDILRALLRGSERADGFKVYGRQEFRRAVTTALFLLRDRKLPAWSTLREHVSAILEGTRTDAVVSAHPAWMFIGGPDLIQDPEFLAATIAYWACSCQLHRSYEAEFPGRPVPVDVYFGSAAQERCERDYNECLLALGRASEGSESIDGLEVYGRQEFRRAVTGALLLLRDNKMPAWETLTQHVASILEGTRSSGAFVNAHPAFIFVDGPHWALRPEFLAATIAYWACSCQLHRSYEAEFPGRRVPRDVYVGSAALKLCEKAYDECLLALGVAQGSGGLHPR